MLSCFVSHALVMQRVSVLSFLGLSNAYACVGPVHKVDFHPPKVPASSIFW